LAKVRKPRCRGVRGRKVNFGPEKQGSVPSTKTRAALYWRHAAGRSCGRRPPSQSTNCLGLAHDESPAKRLSLLHFLRSRVARTR
jgi:hypothetical protein